MRRRQYKKFARRGIPAKSSAAWNKKCRRGLRRWWGASIALIGVYLALTYIFFRLVEKRVRVTGSLGTF